MAGVQMRVFAQLGVNAPRLLGSRILDNRRRAVRETADLLRDIAQAMDDEATFLELTDDLDGGE